MHKTIQFEYITTRDQLLDAAKIWENELLLAIDIECENNLHHYGNYVSVFQISSRKKNWLIDVLLLSELSLFFEMLHNPKIKKVFHDISFDFRILQHQFLCKPKNIFDTQLAAFFLGHKEVGLGSLLKAYFSIQKQHRFQMADWTKRPLHPDLMEYAISDTAHLLGLYDALVAKLSEQKKLVWVEEECHALEQKDFPLTKQEYFEIQGYAQLTDTGRAILKRLFLLREHLAKKVNRPVHFIISNRKLVEYASTPLTVIQWETLRGVHPIVRACAQQFAQAIQKGKQERIPLSPRKKRRFDPAYAARLEKYTELRDKAAACVGIQKHLLASKEQLSEMAISDSLDCLRPWQRLVLAPKSL